MEMKTTINLNRCCPDYVLPRVRDAGRELAGRGIERVGEGALRRQGRVQHLSVRQVERKSLVALNLEPQRANKLPFSASKYGVMKARYGVRNVLYS
jgi:hypothetical protein